MQFLRTTIIAILSLLCMASTAAAIDFYHGSWQDAMLKAKAEKKIIFVDAYTSWCGPCKLMSKKVFPDPTLSETFNEHFINIKLDMEKGDGPSFARKYGITAYPTLLFIDKDGQVLHRKVGMIQAADLDALGKTIVKKHNRVEDYQKVYEKDPDQSTDFILKYLMELNKSGEPTARIANLHLRSTDKIETDSLALIAFYGAETADSKLFEQMLSQADYLKKVVGQEDFEKRIHLIAENTLSLARDFQSPQLLENLAKSKSHIEPRLDHIYLVKYALLEQNDGEFQKVNKEVDTKDHATLELMLNEIAELHLEPEKLPKSELSDWALELTKKTIKPEHVSIAMHTAKLLEDENLQHQILNRVEKNLKKADQEDIHAIEKILSEYQ